MKKVQLDHFLCVQAALAGKASKFGLCGGKKLFCTKGGGAKNY